MQIAISMAH